MSSHPVPSPLFISSRLMAAYKVDGVATLHLSADHTDTDGRTVYEWIIDDDRGREIGRGDDLRSGVGEGVDYLDTMRSLLSFLTACGESWPDGENADLFPPAVGELADTHYASLSIALYEFEGDEG